MGLLLVPVLAGAITFTPPPASNTITSITGLISTIVTIVWQVFVGFVVVMFIIAGTHFFLAEGDPEKVKTARRFVIWGIVGIIVAMLGYSIVQLVSTTVTPAPTACGSSAPACGGTCAAGVCASDGAGGCACF